MNRFHQVIDHGPDVPLHEMAQTVLVAQREVMAEGGGSPGVQTDPAVRTVVHAMGTRLNVQALEDEFLAYHAMNEIVRAKLAQTQAQGPGQVVDNDPAPRRWEDAENAISAVNVGALAGVVGRHALALSDAGQNADSDPALRQIVHQMAYLCATLSPTPQDVQSWAHACRTAVAAQAARDTLIGLELPALEAPAEATLRAW